MPTGYTAAVEDGTITTLEGYALRCARAFGALVHMRNDDLDAPIREPEHNDYYEKRLQSDRARMAELVSMSDADAVALRDAEHAKAVTDWQEGAAREAVYAERYTSMRAKVEAWVPPTPNHDRLKAFMLEQIETSITTPYYTEEWRPRVQTVEEWRASKIAACQWSIDYHEKYATKARDGEEERRAWLRDLRASLAAAPGVDTER